MENLPEILTAVMTAHCTECLMTFTAVSGTPRLATELVRRKFRRHILDGSHDEKADRIAQQVASKISEELLETKEAAES